jgi:hypothetical protein
MPTVSALKDQEKENKNQEVLCEQKYWISPGKKSGNRAEGNQTRKNFLRHADRLALYACV